MYTYQKVTCGHRHNISTEPSKDAPRPATSHTPLLNVSYHKPRTRMSSDPQNTRAVTTAAREVGTYALIWSAANLISLVAAIDRAQRS